MRLFRTLCATLGTLFIVSPPSLGAYAAAIPPLSETSVLATDVHLMTRHRPFLWRTRAALPWPHRCVPPLRRHRRLHLCGY